MGARSTEVVFHVGILLYYGYSDYETLKTVEDVHIKMGKSADDPELQRWLRGSPLYFTFWNLVIHQLYFTICCLEHLSRVCPTLMSTTFLGLAQRIRRKILTSMFIPSAILVATVYWVATWTVPKLVFNDYLEIFPRWVNHSFHTYVVPIAIFELYLCSSLDWVAELGTSEGWKNLNVYLTAYMAATAIYKISTATWPYPFYEHMNFWMKACFVAHVYLSAWFWYYICTQLVRKVFGKRPKKRDVAMKRKHKKL